MPIARGLQTAAIKITAIKEMMAAWKSGEVSADMAQNAGALFSAIHV